MRKQHIKILKQGVDVWNKWRKENPDVIPNLNGVNLSFYNLSGANLQGVRLQGSNLTSSCLKGAKLTNSNLHCANLSYADLSGADLRGSNLRAVNLNYSNLEDTDLTKAYLKDCLGNGKEIRTFQTEFYTCNFTKNFLNIGCKTYTYEEWFYLKDYRIKAMDRPDARSITFWRKYKDVIIMLKKSYGF